MAIEPFPHTYAVTLDNDVVHAPPRPALRIGPPPQFGGTDETWSPEHLLAASVLACLKTTFDAYARRDGLAVLGWHGAATATLVKGPRGPVFSSIDLDVEVEVDAGDTARAQTILATAERACIISNALAVPVHLTSRTVAPPTRAVS